MGLLIYEVDRARRLGWKEERSSRGDLGIFCGEIRWLGLFVVGGGGGFFKRGWFVDVLLVVVMVIGGLFGGGEEAEEGYFPSLSFLFLSFPFLPFLSFSFPYYSNFSSFILQEILMHVDRVLGGERERETRQLISCSLSGFRMLPCGVYFVGVFPDIRGNIILYWFP